MVGGRGVVVMLGGGGRVLYALWPVNKLHRVRTSGGVNVPYIYLHAS